jgi:hypothetical protein
MDKKDRLSEIREHFLWSALVCFVFNFLLDWPSVQAIFGDYLFEVKLINFCCIWFFAIGAGRNGFMLAGRFLKVFENIKSGKGKEED